MINYVVNVETAAIQIQLSAKSSRVSGVCQFLDVAHQIMMPSKCTIMLCLAVHCIQVPFPVALNQLQHALWMNRFRQMVNVNDIILSNLIFITDSADLHSNTGVGRY